MTTNGRVQDLVVAAQWRDQDAFADLVELLKDRQIKRLRRLGLQEADADEVAFEAFRICWRKMTRLKDPSSFEGWVSVMARRLGMKKLAAIRRRDGIHEEFEVDLAVRESPDQRSMNGESVDGLLRGLSLAERELLEAKYLRRLTIKEIARLSGLKGHQIAHRLDKAKDRVRRLRGGDPEDDGRNE